MGAGWTGVMPGAGWPPDIAALRATDGGRATFAAIAPAATPAATPAPALTAPGAAGIGAPGAPCTGGAAGLMTLAVLLMMVVL